MVLTDFIAISTNDTFGQIPKCLKKGPLFQNGTVDFYKKDIKQMLLTWCTALYSSSLTIPVYPF